MSVTVEGCPVIFLEKREAVFCFSNLLRYRANPVSFSGRKEVQHNFKISDLLFISLFFFKGSKGIRTLIFKIFLFNTFSFLWSFK